MKARTLSAVGITLLMYANQVMYVSEVFKVEQGRITHIDNIGLVKPGLEHTTGFGTGGQARATAIR